MRETAIMLSLANPSIPKSRSMPASLVPIPKTLNGSTSITTIMGKTMRKSKGVTSNPMLNAKKKGVK